MNWLQRQLHICYSSNEAVVEENTEVNYGWLKDRPYTRLFIEGVCNKCGKETLRIAHIDPRVDNWETRMYDALPRNFRSKDRIRKEMKESLL